MNYKPPPPTNLKASSEWLKWKFGVKGHARGALKQVQRCLDEIGCYEHDFLMSKATLLSHLQKWNELLELLRYLEKRYPEDPEVSHEYAQFHSAHGRWEEALKFIHKAESRMTKDQAWFLELLYTDKLECLVALGKPEQAKQEARQILKKHRKFSMIRAELKHLVEGTYKQPTAYATPEKKR